MPLFDVPDAVSVIGDTLAGDMEQGLNAAILPRIRRHLDSVYAGRAAPRITSVLDATVHLLVRCLRERISREHPEQCASAVAAAFAKHHGVEFRLGPYNDSAKLMSTIRDRNLGHAELRHWLLKRIVAGDEHTPLMPPVTRLPFRNCIFGVSYPVTESSHADLARSAYITNAIEQTITRLGGQLLVPSPRGLNINGWRTDDEVMRDVVARLGRVGSVLALTDNISGGPGIEAHTAANLKLTTVLIQTSDRRSPWFAGRNIHIVAYGQRVQAAAQMTVDLLLANRWSVLNSERHRSDREIMQLERRTQMLTEYQALSDDQQTRVAEETCSSRERIELLLSSGIGMAIGQFDEIQTLQDALKVPHQGPTAIIPELDVPEMEALSVVAHERGLDIRDVYFAAEGVLRELALQGEKRKHIDDPALWRDYFDQLGLTGQNPDTD